MYEKTFLGLKEAEVAVRAIIEEAAKDPTRPIAVAVADVRGDIITLVRMDGGKALYNDFAIKKASQSGFMGLDSRKFFQNRMNKEISGEWGACEPPGEGRTYSPGGVTVVAPGATRVPVVYGGIGVSGRRADEDEELAFIGLKALQEFLWPSR